MNKILIIGAGQLGERSIQSIQNSKNIYKLYYYEEDNIRSDYIKTKYKITQIDNIKDLSKFDIIHVATTSKGRHIILLNKTIRDDCLVLVEKPTASNIDELKEQSKWDYKDNYLVNLNRRYFPINQKLKSILKAPFSLKCMAKDLHMLGNISHFLDLMRFYGVTSNYKITIEDKYSIFDTKRKNYKDIRGQLVINYECGSRLCLIDDSSINHHGYIYTYAFKEMIFKYNETRKIIIENNLINDFINIEDLSKFHSELFIDVINDFSNGVVILPMLYEVALDNLSSFDLMHDIFNTPRRSSLPVS